VEKLGINVSFTGALGLQEKSTMSIMTNSEQIKFFITGSLKSKIIIKMENLLGVTFLSHTYLPPFSIPAGRHPS